MTKRKCKKSANYPSVRAARTALLNHSAKATSLAPTHWYWCGQHKAYHLTGKVR